MSENITLDRKEIIKGLINSRVELGEINKCYFYFTEPGIIYDIYDDGRLSEIKTILKSNNVSFNYTDAVDGSWNLNSDWIKTDPMDCIVEYSGVFPIHWKIEDVVLLEELHNTGKLVILVHKESKKENGKFNLNY